MQSLSLGVANPGLGLEAMLEQIGINWLKADLAKGIKQESFAAIAVNKVLSGNERQNLARYLERGGAAITFGNFAGSLGLEIEAVEKFIRFIEPSGELFNGSGLLWVQSKGFLLHGASQGLINGKQPAVLLKKVGRGLLIVLPFSPGSLFLDERAEKRGFYSRKRFPGERVSSVSKGNLSTVLLNCLSKLFEHRALPLVHKWFYPGKSSSVFGFHVDVDNGFEQDIEKAYRVLKGKARWFLNIEEVKKSSKALQLLAAEKVGSHGFHHCIYSSFQENLANISRAQRFLESRGIKPMGFSSPNGAWNQSLGKALEKKGCGFAVAFGLGYDGLPFHPVVGGRRAGLLLVPVHPICIGLLKTMDFSEAEMREYFEMVFERNISANLPAFFYGHPFKRIARFPNVVSGLVETAEKRRDVCKADVAGFAAWWKKRERKRFSAGFEKNRLFLRTLNNDAQFSVRILFNGFEKICPMEEKQIDLSRLALQRKSKRLFLNDTVRKPSGVGKKFFIKSLLGKILKALPI
ncbi:MAG: hypothetical protein JW744_03245 [Candidatus Diapherotrites archaeon]|uniref:NodB homology domain-containing protein n=1 Tax=Candidatus Iainarchaeum sp. TaxID=3101447 RepID=A0A939C8X9_9ARCH|nr:hypothetical protein [Candidatus Diapherotrites archaeon]